MTNDLTTLDGSLDELGENLATNLVAMGVSDADKTDGLTTLANKILNAEPSVAGLELNTNLTLTKITENLYTATLTGEYDDTTVTNVDLIGVITGATITLKDGQTTIGTGVTDNNGIATIGVELNEGQHTLKAIFAGTENFKECESTTMSISIEPGTFTELQTIINNATSGSTITLNKSYKYNVSTDSSLTNGIIIGKNITINGNEYIIDGSNSKRAFYIDGQYTVDLNDLKIQNCYNNKNGGAIYAIRCNLTIKDSTFTQNNAENLGGAIRAENSATININNTQFTNNTAQYGGAIYTTTSATVNINNTTFKQNTATSDGGAIHANTNAIININNTQFTNNTAYDYGGAIYNKNNSIITNNLTATNCTFKDNTAVYADIYSYNAITVYDCTISNISTTCYNVTNVNTQ